MLAAYDIICSSVKLSVSNTLASVTDRIPVVKVPVLSKQIVSRLRQASIASPPLNKIPNLAATPVPMMIALGADNARAQGQDTTKTNDAVVSGKFLVKIGTFNQFVNYLK